MNLQKHIEEAKTYKISVEKIIYSEHKSLFMSFYNRHNENDDYVMIEGEINFIIKENIMKLVENEVNFRLELMSASKVIYSGIPVSNSIKDSTPPQVKSESKSKSPFEDQRSFFDESSRTDTPFNVLETNKNDGNTIEKILINYRYTQSKDLILASAIFCPIFLFIGTLFTINGLSGGFFVFLFICCLFLVPTIRHYNHYHKAKNNIEQDKAYQEIRREFDIRDLNENLNRYRKLEFKKVIVTKDYLIIMSDKFMVIAIKNIIYLKEEYISSNNTSKPGIHILKSDGYLTSVYVDRIDVGRRIVQSISREHGILHDLPNLKMYAKPNGEFIDKKFVQNCIEHRKHNELTRLDQLLNEIKDKK